jgi:hypothetical protein
LSISDGTDGHGSIEAHFSQTQAGWDPLIACSYFSYSLFFTLLLALISWTKGFHCDVSIYTYNIL